VSTRDEFLRIVWEQIIDAPKSDSWIDNFIAEATNRPDRSFADAGVALQRLLDGGADRADLSKVARAIAYETVFSLMYMLDDPGVDDGDVFMLHESLLSADPSGMEGRPGSSF